MTSYLLFQNKIYVYLAGKGRGVNHQGRVVPISRMSQLRQADQSTTLDITSEKSYLGNQN